MLYISTSELSFEAIPIFELFMVQSFTVRVDASPPLIPLSPMLSILQEIISTVLPEKSIASFPTSINVEFVKVPVLKSESKASDNTFENVQLLTIKFELIIFKISSQLLFLNVVLFISTSDS